MDMSSKVRRQRTLAGTAFTRRKGQDVHERGPAPKSDCVEACSQFHNASNYQKNVDCSLPNAHPLVLVVTSQKCHERMCLRRSASPLTPWRFSCTTTPRRSDFVRRKYRSDQANYRDRGRSPRDARSICVAERRRLGGQFEDQIDRRLCGAPQVGEPGFTRHLAQALFARLRTEAEPDLLRQRVRRARHGRRGIIHAADRVQVLLQPITGIGLYQQHLAVGLERFAATGERADRIAEIVQAVHEADEVEAVAVELGRGLDLERDVARHALLGGALARGRDRRVMIIQADEARLGERLRH